MPAINKTSLGLNQWLGNEYPKRIDFVEDNKIIDDELIKRVKYTDVATDTTAGIVKFGTETGNAIDAETWKQAIGQSLGGYVSKVENKEAGKWYINDLTDGKIYKCIQNHTSTSFDITKFVDITNVGLSDKVENLFGFGESWIKFPNGLVLFWKSYLITEYPQTCHFPLEFNSVPNILVTPVYGGTNLDFNVYVDTATKKSVKVFNKNKGWIVILAIGYAK